MDNTRGFTLIEVLIAMFVSLVIMGGAYMFFNNQQRQTTIQTNVSDAQQTLRAAMDFMSRDIRMIGYDPTNSDNFGITDIKFRDLDDSTSTTGNSFIRFTWDKIEDGVVANDETIDFGLVDSATITPGITDLYLRLPNDTNTRDVLSANIISLGLAYAYDNDNNGELDTDGAGDIIWAVDKDNDDDWDSLNTTTGVTAETGTPIDESTIRAVRIWLLSQSLSPDPKYTDTNTYIVGSHIITPNDNFRHRLQERTVLCRNMGL
ncbi:MAG: PilW family protein [Deltaproteobacteria bacterium]|nr:PilW family protein [Deltaproteobacteria bacterium]